MSFILNNTATQINSTLSQSVLQNSGNYVGPTGNNADNDAAFCIQTRNKQTALYIANGYTSFLHSNVLGFNSVNADASMCLYANKGFTATDNSATYFSACNGQLRFGTLTDKTALVINSKKLGLGTESPYWHLDMQCDINAGYVLRMQNNSTGVGNQGSIVQLGTFTSGNNSTYYSYNYEIRAGQSNPAYPYAYRGGNTIETYDDARRHTFRGCNARVKLLLHDNGDPGSITESYFLSCNNFNGFIGSGDWVVLNTRNDKKLGAIAYDVQNPSGYTFNSIQHRQFDPNNNATINGASEMYFYTTPSGGNQTSNFYASDRRKLALTLAWNQCAYFASGVTVADNLTVSKNLDLSGLAVLRSSRTRFGADNGNYGYHWFASRDYTASDPGSLGYGFNQTAGGYITEHQWMISGKMGMCINADAQVEINNCARANTGAWNGLKLVQVNKFLNGDSLGQFLDFANENVIVHSSVHSQNWADGSSELRFLVTPAGARNADRRVCAAKIFPDKTFCSYGCIIAAGGIGGGNASLNTITSIGVRTTHDQGAYLEWNKDASNGKTYLLNQKGGGGGGFVIGEVSSTNTISERLVIDGNGHALLCVNAGGVDNAYALGLVNAATPNQGQLFFYPSVDVGAFNTITCACDAMILYTRSGVNTACGLTIASHSTACNGLRIDNCTNIGISISNPSVFGPNVIDAAAGFAGTANDSTVVRNIAIKKDDEVLTIGAYCKNGVDQYSYISASNGNNTNKNKLVLQPCCGSVFIGNISSPIISGSTTLNAALNISSTGNYQISFSHPSVTRGSGWFNSVDSTNRFYVINQSGRGVYLANQGTAWTALSDEREKNIIEYITGASEKISTLRTVIGNYKDDPIDTRRSFLIAQDVQKVLPEAVDSASPDGVLGLAYTDTIPLIIAAIKEMKLDIDKIKQKLGI